MKNIIFILTLTIIFSCNNADNNPVAADTPAPAASGQSDASIVFEAEGKAVMTHGMNVRRFIWDSKTSVPLLNIMSDARNEKMVININLHAAVPGTYTFSPDNDALETVGTFWPDYSNIMDSYLFESGSFILTEVDESKGIVNGTFSGTAVNKDGKSVRITNGKLINLKMSPGIMNMEEETDKLTQ